MANFGRVKTNKNTAEITDPLFLLADLLMKIDKRKKIVPIPDDSNDKNKSTNES